MRQAHGEPARDPRPGRADLGDAELLRATAAGSEEAFAQLRARYAGSVASVCRALAGTDREDCEQEVFARVWEKAALYDPERGSAAGWLSTLARRTALNTRARSRHPEAVATELGEAAQPALVERFWLEAALSRLPERERTVIELHYQRDLSESAIARELRVPLGSVKSWKRRGLNRLATLLGEEAP
jgi:RNA polymerase sigma-70 factor (ECF subfamily)